MLLFLLLLLRHSLRLFVHLLLFLLGLPLLRRLAQVIGHALLLLIQHIRTVNDPDDDETERTNAMGDEEVYLLVDPSAWCPFPINSILLCSEGKTIGFHTCSVVYGTEKISHD